MRRFPPHIRLGNLARRSRQRGGARLSDTDLRCGGLLRGLDGNPGCGNQSGKHYDPIERFHDLLHCTRVMRVLRERMPSCRLVAGVAENTISQCGAGLAVAGNTPDREVRGLADATTQIMSINDYFMFYIN